MLLHDRMTETVLGDLGADIIKIEPPTGDHWSIASIEAFQESV